MTTMVLSTILAVTLAAMTSSNPLKISFFLLAASSLIFLQMHLGTGTTWVPLIFFLLFMGGILMMFMILCSIMPNEPTRWGSFVKSLGIATIWGASGIFLSKETGLQTLQMKVTASNYWTLTFATVTILFYFLSFISSASKQTFPLRSYVCRFFFGFVSRK